MLTPRRRRAVYVSCTALVAAAVVVAVLDRRRPARPRPHAPVWSLPNLTVDNVLERCDDALTAADVLYRVVGRPHFNYLDVLAVRTQDRRCLAASNEWLSLLRRPHYAGWGPGVRRRLHYAPVVELYARLAQEDAGAATVVDEAATPLITSFSRGTVHGFTDFWLILAAWCDRGATGRANRTLLVYEGSDRGMLDVVRAATSLEELDVSGTGCVVRLVASALLQSERVATLRSLSLGAEGEVEHAVAARGARDELREEGREPLSPRVRLLRARAAAAGACEGWRGVSVRERGYGAREKKSRGG